MVLVGNSFFLSDYLSLFEMYSGIYIHKFEDIQSETFIQLQ